MYKKLIKLANYLDSEGLIKEADDLDNIIKKYAAFCSLFQIAFLGLEAIKGCTYPNDGLRHLCYWINENGELDATLERDYVKACAKGQSPWVQVDFDVSQLVAGESRIKTELNMFDNAEECSEYLNLSMDDPDSYYNYYSVATNEQLKDGIYTIWIKMTQDGKFLPNVSLNKPGGCVNIEIPEDVGDTGDTGLP